MKKILTFLALCITTISFAQLENANWCFGLNAGVHFNSPPILPTPTTSQIDGDNNIGRMSTGASVSKADGQLLFYTDGVNVWDGNHLPLNNGTGLYGYSELTTTAQNVVIVPKPGHPGIYYIFTLSTISIIGPGNPVGRGGIHYSVVDMNVGVGQVTIKNVSVNTHGAGGGVPIDYAFDYSQTHNNPVFITYRSRMTTSLHAAGDKIWVSIIADFYFNYQNNRMFYNFLVAQDGISGKADGINPQPTVATPISSSNYFASPLQGNGLMKISPNGEFLCETEAFDVNLYTYDNQFGTIGSTPTNVYRETSGMANVGFGVEFSPNSNLIYFSRNSVGLVQDGLILPPSVNNSGSIYQYNITGQKLALIYQYSSTPTPESTPLPVVAPFGIQLGMDDNIYVCAYGVLLEFANYLGVIDEPNIPGTGCLFNPMGLLLASNTWQRGSLPQWVHKATVNNVWPKVYSYPRGGDPGPFNVQPFPYLVAGSGSNIFYGLPTHNMTININHNGGIVPTNPGTYTVQYNKITGITNWIHPNMVPKFVLNSGIVQVLTSPFDPMSTLITTGYYDQVSGFPVSGPVPNNEVILAEDNGTYITRSTNSLHVHSLLGSSPPEPFINGYSDIEKTIYYPITINNPTPKLFVQYRSNFGGSTLAVYELNNNSLVIINTISPNSGYGLVQVNNTGEVFCWYPDANGRIEKYDYINNTRTPLSVPGFVNSYIEKPYSCNPYVNDRMLVAKRTESKLYYINTDPLNVQQKSIPYSRQFTPTSEFTCGYFFDGDDLYMNVGADDEIITIGNQTIPPLGNATTGVTKFNINFDFTRPSNTETVTQELFTNTELKEPVKPVLSATLNPNPAKNILQVNIKQADSEKNRSFLVSITNSYGITVLTQNSNQKTVNLNVSQFKTGIYYVTISTDKGDKTTQMFIKE